MSDSPEPLASEDSGDADSDDGDVARLRLATLRLSRAIRTHAVEDLTPSQLAILGTITRHGPVTVGRIAEIEHVKPPSASKIVAGLEALSLVERSADPDDRRCVRLVTSPTGLDQLASVRTAGRSWLARQVALLDPADREAIAAAVPALERLLVIDEADDAASEPS